MEMLFRIQHHSPLASPLKIFNVKLRQPAPALIATPNMKAYYLNKAGNLFQPEEDITSLSFFYKILKKIYPEYLYIFLNFTPETGYSLVIVHTQFHVLQDSPYPLTLFSHPPPTNGIIFLSVSKTRFQSILLNHLYVTDPQTPTKILVLDKRASGCHVSG